MKYFFITSMFMLILSITSLHAQSRIGTVRIETFIDNIPILSIKDSSLIKSVDYHINEVDTCRKNNRPKYVYNLSINNNYADNNYRVYFNFSPPRNLDLQSNYGILKYNGSIYAIYGDAVNHFFANTEKKETISFYDDYYHDKERDEEMNSPYYIVLGRLIYPEDLCEKLFIFEAGKLESKPIENDYRAAEEYERLRNEYNK